jgi:hypothetical protein
VLGISDAKRAHGDQLSDRVPNYAAQTHRISSYKRHNSMTIPLMI